MANIPRRGSQLCVLSGGDGVERDKICEARQASSYTAKSQGEKGNNSKIPRLTHRPPRSQRPSSATSSSSHDTDHSMSKADITKLTKVKNKQGATLLLNAACVVANVVKHECKPSPAFSATDSTLKFLILKRKNRTKSDSCVNADQKGRKNLFPNRPKSDTAAIKASKSKKTSQKHSEVTMSRSAAVSDAFFPTNRAIPDQLQVSDCRLKKCESNIRNDDTGDTDDNTLVQSPSCSLEMGKSLNLVPSKSKASERKDTQETQNYMVDILDITEERLPQHNMAKDVASTASAEKVQKLPSTEQASDDNIKRSFSPLNYNGESAPSLSSHVTSGKLSENFHNGQSFCSVDPESSPSTCTMQGTAKVGQRKLKLGNRPQVISPDEHRLRSMQLQSRMADLINFGKSCLQNMPKELNDKCHKKNGNNNAAVICGFSKSLNNTMGLKMQEFDSLHQNPMPRTIHSYKKGEAGGNLSSTSEGSYENKCEESQKTEKSYEDTGIKLTSTRSPSNCVTTDFVDGPEIIPNKKLTKQVTQQNIERDEMDRNTIGIQVNVFSVVEFKTRFGVDMGVQVHESDLELVTISLKKNGERSSSSISVQTKRSTRPSYCMTKFLNEPSGSLSAGASSLVPLFLDEAGSALKIDLKGLKIKESTSQVPLDENGSKLDQLSLNGLKGTDITLVALTPKKFRSSHTSLKEKDFENTQAKMEEQQFSSTKSHSEEIFFQGTDPPLDVCCNNVEIRSHSNIDHFKEIIVDAALPIQESSIQKNFHIDVNEMEQAHQPFKDDEIFQENCKSPIEMVRPSLATIAKSSSSFRTSQNLSTQFFPDLSSNDAKKHSRKPPAHFTNLKKNSKQDETAKIRGSNTQVKGEHAVVIKSDSRVGATKSDQRERTASQSANFGKKARKIPRWIPVSSKDNSTTIRSTINNTCDKNLGFKLTSDCQKAGTFVFPKEKSCRISRQASHCVACREMSIERTQIDQFRLSTNNKERKKKAFSAL